MLLCYNFAYYMCYLLVRDSEGQYHYYTIYLSVS